VREYSGSGYAGRPEACRLGSLVPGLPAGRYIADLRLSTGVLGSPGVVTVAPGEAASPARRDLTGNWFNRDEPGWGLNIVQGDSGKLFIAWVMYSPTDNSSASYSFVTYGHWLIVPDGRWLTPTTWRGVAFQTLNVAMFEPDDAKLLQATPAGYVEISFTGAGEATMRGRFIVGTTVEPMIEKHATLRRFEF
jgi:hypothetical protein